MTDRYVVLAMRSIDYGLEAYGPFPDMDEAINYGDFLCGRQGYRYAETKALDEGAAAPGDEGDDIILLEGKLDDGFAVFGPFREDIDVESYVVERDALLVDIHLRRP